MNFHLSDRRAAAVVDYFVAREGLPIRRMLNPTGFGEEQPVANNDTAAGRAMNRRAGCQGSRQPRRPQVTTRGD